MRKKAVARLGRNRRHQPSHFLLTADFVWHLFRRAYVFFSMDSVLQDFRYAIRMLTKDRGFFIMAVIALALGIGSVTAIFSVIDNALLDTFPYKGGTRLMGIEIHDSSRAQDGGRQGYTQAEFVHLRQQNHVFGRFFNNVSRVPRS